jgi:hypothetical protein
MVEANIDIFTGDYKMGDDFASAELTIKYLGANFIQATGIALYNKPSGCPSIGQLDFVAEIYETNKAQFEEDHSKYKLELTFLGNNLIAKEKFVVGYFGNNASFGGEYFKVS